MGISGLLAPLPGLMLDMGSASLRVAVIVAPGQMTTAAGPGSDESPSPEPPQPLTPSPPLWYPRTRAVARQGYVLSSSKKGGHRALEVEVEVDHRRLAHGRRHLGIETGGMSFRVFSSVSYVVMDGSTLSPGLIDCPLPRPSSGALGGWEAPSLSATTVGGRGLLPTPADVRGHAASDVAGA